MAVNSGGAGDAQRELWREARRHIGEYESRTSELALDLAAEGKALAAAKDELAALRREAQSQRAAKDAADRAALDEHDRMAALSRQRDSELAESGRLTHQLAALGTQLEAAVATAREQEQERQTHLADLQAHLDSLRAYRRQCTQQHQQHQQGQQLHKESCTAPGGSGRVDGAGVAAALGDDAGAAHETGLAGSAGAGGTQLQLGLKRPLLQAGDGSSGGGAVDDTMRGGGPDQLVLAEYGAGV
ncbi:hypothetical protein HYH02_013637 [Chlamydomonas schloesseri]|uniref:Uncharacterized protein n=1 Tax=Chlamydomonas schloesseri TaxID=2026947 RepID=A0A835SYN1_9CHLO|nr:hypothetical protein HYH02_013637 [Chlamydomonas schloesseri]|eukprot:KAG2430639.1 hypothetical protein HYH02_013637 [Chlamydomonas schloesseri]